MKFRSRGSHEASAHGEADIDEAEGFCVPFCFANNGDSQCDSQCTTELADGVIHGTADAELVCLEARDGSTSEGGQHESDRDAATDLAR